MTENDGNDGELARMTGRKTTQKGQTDDIKRSKIISAVWKKVQGRFPIFPGHFAIQGRFFKALRVFARFQVFQGIQGCVAALQLN